MSQTLDVRVSNVHVSQKSATCTLHTLLRYSAHSFESRVRDQDSVRDKSTWSSTLHTLLRDSAHSHTVLVSRLSVKRGECVSGP